MNLRGNGFVFERRLARGQREMWWLGGTNSPGPLFPELFAQHVNVQNIIVSMWLTFLVLSEGSRLNNEIMHEACEAPSIYPAGNVCGSTV